MGTAGPISPPPTVVSGGYRPCEKPMLNGAAAYRCLRFGAEQESPDSEGRAVRNAHYLVRNQGVFVSVRSSGQPELPQQISG